MRLTPVKLEQLTDDAFIKKVMNSAKASVEANAVKQHARDTGYIYSMSLYGVLTDTTTNKSEYRRLEVLSDVFWTGDAVELIYRFFQNMKPSKIYTIWLYSGRRRSLLLVGGYD